MRRLSLHAQAIDRLRDMIVEGDLAPGQKLVEIELCRQLEISRTPLREALKVLASEGLVELLPNRGARVTRITLEEIGDLFEVIAGLEGIAAEAACRKMSAADLDALKAMHERITKHHAERRRHDYFQENHKIHEQIVALAGNRVLQDMHARLMVRARRGRYLAILSTERWDEAVREHDEIMDAFAERDAARAAAIWRRHVARTGDVVRAFLSAEPVHTPRTALYA